MSIAVTCGGCGKSYKVDDAFAGKKAKCKSCGGVMVVPAIGASSSAAPANKASSASAGVRKPSSKPAVAKVAEPTPGEFDFSSLDDIENTGTIDHDAPVTPMPVRRAEVSSHPGYTAAPAHLRGGGGGSSTKEPFKPGPAVYIGVGVGVAAIIIVAFMMMSGGGSTSSQTASKGGGGGGGGGGKVNISGGGGNSSAADDDDEVDDGKGLTAAKLARRAEKRRQAEIDAIRFEVKPSEFPPRTEFPELPDRHEFYDTIEYALNLSGQFQAEPMGMRMLAPGADKSPAPHARPCVVLTARCDDVLEGGTSHETDMKFQLALARAGIPTLLHDGSQWSGNVRPESLNGTITEFVQTDAGAHFVRNAFNFVIARDETIDPKRMFLMGFGGSARSALNFAAGDHRVAGVIAIDPICDPRRHLDDPLPEIERKAQLTGLGKFLDRTSPLLRAKDIKCPVLIIRRPDRFKYALEAAGVTGVPDLPGDTGEDPAAAAAPADGAGAATSKPATSKPADEVTEFVDALKAAGGQVTVEEYKPIPDSDEYEVLMGHVARWVKKQTAKAVFSE